MERLFVDTGGWFAYFVASDPDHAATAEVLSGWSGRLLTTDYVFDEVTTLLRYRAGHRQAAQAGAALRDRSAVDLVRVQLDDFEAAWRTFTRQKDKQYSFTDCTSFAVMKRLGITTAAAVDEHFRQAGFRVLPPA
jgi:predicted nucleic acid-binding protein